MGRKHAVEEVERAVQERLPHLRLADHARYEGKGLPATWRCVLHDRAFRAKASSLIQAGAVGCPDCVSARALEKRRKQLADPDLDRHLAIIAGALGEKHAEVYRLRCSGKKLKEIGVAFGVSDQGVNNWLVRIRSVLAQARRA